MKPRRQASSGLERVRRRAAAGGGGLRLLSGCVVASVVDGVVACRAVRIIRAYKALATPGAANATLRAGDVVAVARPPFAAP